MKLTNEQIKFHQRKVQKVEININHRVMKTQKL